MVGISTSIRRFSKLRSIMVLAAKEHPGVVLTASVAGFAIVVVTPEANRDGTRSGARRCDERWIFCATKTSPSLRQRAERCSSIRGRHATTASRSFSISINPANSFFSHKGAVGGRTMARADSSRIATHAASDVHELRLVFQRHLGNRNDSDFEVRWPRYRLNGTVGFAFSAGTLLADPGGSQEQSIRDRNRRGYFRTIRRTAEDFKYRNVGDVTSLRSRRQVAHELALKHDVEAIQRVCEARRQKVAPGGAKRDPGINDSTKSQS